MLALLAAGGVRPASGGRLQLRRRVNARKKAWIFLNPGAEAVTEIIATTGFAKVSDLLGEQMGTLGADVSLTVAGLDVRVLILER